MFDPTPEQIEATAESLEPGLFTLDDHHYSIRFDNPIEYRVDHQNAGRAIAQRALVAAAGATPQEPTARVVGVSYEASPSCSQGVCPKGCSHLMWECKACSCEGGWGSDRALLEDRAAQHTCSDAIKDSVQVDEAKLVEITRSTIDRRPYSDGVRREIRGLEHAVAREIAARSAEWLRGGEQ